MDKKKVFISYSEKDITYAKWLGSVFETNGITAIVSDYKNYSIARATACIDEADAFVSLYSKNTKQIDDQSKETEHAFNSNKNIFPVVIDKCNIEGQYNYYLSRGERFEIYKNKSKFLKLLIGRIKNSDENERIKIKNYHVDLLSEEEIDNIIAGKKEKLNFFKKLSPFSRLYSKNFVVRFALKCYTIALGLPVATIVLGVLAKAFVDVTEILFSGEGAISIESFVIAALSAMLLLGLWNLAYFPSILIAKLKIQNKFVIAMLVIVSVYLPARLLNIL